MQRGDDRRAVRYDVFVSFSDADEAWVEDWLVPRLRAAGLTVCAKDCFEPGAPLLDEMARVIGESARMLAVVTPDWVDSQWADFESLLVQSADPNARTRRLIPLLVEPVEPPERLPERVRLLSFVDMTEADEREEQLARVIDHLQGRAELPDLHPEAFPPKSVWRRLEVVAGLVLVVVLLLLALVATPQVAALLPQRMNGNFNIAVSPFVTLRDGRDAGAEPGRQRAVDVTRFLKNEMANIATAVPPGLQPVVIWGPEERVPKVTDEADAPKRAAALGAHVLLYGILSAVGEARWQLAPRFRIEWPEVLANAPELGGPHYFGRVLEFDDRLVSTAATHERLKMRVDGLVPLVEGLSWYAGGTADDYAAAVERFRAAARTPWGSGMGEGQEIIQYFLGNALLKESYFLEPESVERGLCPADKRRCKLDESQAAADQALRMDPDYDRAHNLLAAILFQKARPLLCDPNACNWDWALLDEAAREQQLALSVAQAQPPDVGSSTAITELRTRIGLGEIDFWRGQCLDSATSGQPAWQAAEANLVAARSELEAIPNRPDATRLELARVETYLAQMSLDRAVQLLMTNPVLTADGRALLADASQQFASAIDNALSSGLDEGRGHARDVMPIRLRALCLADDPAAARAALDDFVQRVGENGAQEGRLVCGNDSAGAPPATRDAILANMVPTERARCFGPGPDTPTVTKEATP